MDFSHVLTDLTTQILLALLLLGFVELVVYYSIYYLFLGRKAQKVSMDVLPEDEKGLPAVSVVLVAHNDVEYLRENLAYILEQDYEDFEVVVVDYLSTDQTPFVLKLYQENYTNLKVVNFKEDVNMFKGNKYPLSIGIRSAKNDTVVLTDADCRPAGLQWLRHIVKAYNNGRTDFVLGYCERRTGNNLLGMLERYDNLTYSADYLTCGMRRHPYTGCGNNLSYRRQLFFSKGGFISHYAIPDGADDMFVNQNATGRNTTVCLHCGGHTTVQAPKKFSYWRQSRQHRYATYRYHSFMQKFRRALPDIGIVSFYGAMVALFVMNLFPWQILAGCLFVKLALQIASFAQLQKGFGEKYVCWFSPLLELYFLLSNTILSLFPLKYKIK